MCFFSVPKERSVVNKERLSGAYRLSAYYLSKLGSEFAAGLVFPTLYWLLIYFCVGLNLQAKNFFGVLMTTWLLCFTSMVSVS